MTLSVFNLLQDMLIVRVNVFTGTFPKIVVSIKHQIIQMFKAIKHLVTMLLCPVSHHVDANLLHAVVTGRSVAG